MVLEYSKKELEQIAKLYGVKGAYKLKKSELIEELIKVIPEGMAENLPMLDAVDIERFEAVMKEGKVLVTAEEIEAYYNLMELELLQCQEVGADTQLSVAEVIKEAYSNINKDQVMKAIEANNKLRRHVIGLLNLYGVVKIDWVIELYNRYHEEKINKTRLVAFMKKDMRILCKAKIMEDYIVEEMIYALDKNNFYDFLKTVIDRDYFVPTKEFIEVMNDEAYYDQTLQVEKLKSYLKKHFVQDDTLIEQAIVTITMFAKVDCDGGANTLELMLEELSNLGFEFKDLGQINEILKHITAVVNTTRKWVNKGFTSQELSPHTFDTKTGQKVKVLDIGRNAPCPCGSGKKYKKCCGNA